MPENSFLNDYQKKCKDAEKIRKKIIDAVYVNGGHLSSNLGVVELTQALVSSFDTVKDDILFDVGHQSYAYKILTGRDLTRIRQIDGVSPFTLRSESPNDKHDSGHSGDALPTGIGMALAKELEGINTYTVIVIGDASFKNGLTQEAIDVLANRTKLKNVIVIINKNGMAIQKEWDKESLDDDVIREDRISYRENHIHEYDENSYIAYVKKIREDSIDENKYPGLTYLGKVEGHDPYALQEAFESAKEYSYSHPVILEVLTRKGYGKKEYENDEIGFYHGVNPGFIKDDTSTDFAYEKENILLNMMEKDKDIFVLTPAMETSSSLLRVFEKYPKRCLDVGIAEECSLVVSSGLSLKGKKPVIDIYSTFLQRGIDQLIMNLSRQDCTVMFLLERCSFVGGDGSSHHGIFDVALLRSVPNVLCYMPYDKTSLDYLMNNKGFQVNRSIFIRFPKEKMPITSLPFDYQDICFLHKGQEKTLLLSVGPKGLYLLEDLADIACDKALILSLLSFDVKDLLSYDTILFYDPYSIEEGTTSYLKEKLFESGFKGNCHSLTLEKKFYPYGQNSDIEKENGMDLESAKSFVKKYC